MTFIYKDNLDICKDYLQVKVLLSKGNGENNEAKGFR